jgi:co-chaperonin GroES (HSP10)
MPRIDPTWKEHEKKMHSENPTEAVRATDAFESERRFQMEKSETVRKWEEDRKSDLASQKPDWKRRQLKDLQNQQDAPMRRMLDIGSFYGGVRPAPGYMIVEPDEIIKTTASGILLPDRDNERQNTGRVRAVGSRVPIPSSKSRFFEPPVTQGEHVVFKRLCGADIDIDGKPCKLMLFSDILAILDD